MSKLLMTTDCRIPTAVCTTYAIESQPAHTGQAAVLVAFIRQLYAFTGPFYFTVQFDHMGTLNGKYPA